MRTRVIIRRCLYSCSQKRHQRKQRTRELSAAEQEEWMFCKHSVWSHRGGCYPVFYTNTWQSQCDSMLAVVPSGKQRRNANWHTRLPVHPLEERMGAFVCLPKGKNSNTIYLGTDGLPRQPALINQQDNLTASGRSTLQRPCRSSTG